MAEAITDADGVPLGYVAQALPEGTESGVLEVRVPCSAGRFLTAADDPIVRVLARRTGSGDAFVDLQSAPYDLTPHDGETVAFDVKLLTGAVSANTTFAVPVRVTPRP
jgi:hypothetical protein